MEKKITFNSTACTLSIEETGKKTRFYIGKKAFRLYKKLAKTDIVLVIDNEKL